MREEVDEDGKQFSSSYFHVFARLLLVRSEQRVNDTRFGNEGKEEGGREGKKEERRDRAEYSGEEWVFEERERERERINW